jgi:undecaprenyl-diphosphatase
VNFIQSLFFGILQGLTEFFPISSSAHLKLFKIFFNISNNQNFHLLDLSCHMGTLVVSVIYLKDEIKKLIFCKKDMFYIFLAIMPLVPIYLFSKNIRLYFSQDKFLAFFLFLTAFFLFLASFLEKKNIKIKSTSKIKDVLLIGVMQSLAMLPGISRSASTITAANIRGWKLEDSIKFSYLLSIPTILGGSIIETIKEIKHNSFINELPLSSYVISFLSSLIVGFFAIRILFSIKDAKKLKYFGYYLVALGLITLFFINF